MADPLAYLITISVYGSRLHGDPRGTSRRIWQADPSQPPVATNPTRVAAENALMKNASPVLEARHRGAIERTIRDVCHHNEWTLHALNVRTNHMHIVLSCDPPPEKAMSSLKAWSTRRLREAGLAGGEERLWARHGSTRYLWDEQDVLDAVEYVTNGQGPDLPRT